MADDFTLNPGSGGITARADQLLTGQYVPYSKVMDGTADSTNVWIIDSSGRGKTIADAGTGPWPVTDNGGLLSVDDGGGSLTIDGTVASSGTVTVSVTGTATVADNQTLADNSAFTDGTSKVFLGGYILDETAGTALTENDAAAARIDSKRAQVLVIEDATTRGQRAAVTAGGLVKVDASGATVPVSGSVSLTGTSAVNVAQVAGTTTDTNSGNKSAGTQRVVLATDQPALTNALKVDPSGVTSPVSIAATVKTSQTPSTSGGYTVSRLLSAASTNATSVKASAGQVYGFYLYNSAAYTVFLKLYNKASAPTVGTDTPFMTVPVPAGGGAVADWDGGIAMGTGIAFAITKAIADNDTTAVAANDLAVNLLYA